MYFYFLLAKILKIISGVFAMLGFNILQKKPVQASLNPINYSQGFKHEASNNLLQIFHYVNFHILEKLYYYALANHAAEPIPCILAILDFEMTPTKQKRDFIIGNFVSRQGGFDVNVPGRVSLQVVASAQREDQLRLNAPRARRNAMLRNNNRILGISQSPVTFSETDFMKYAIETLAETWGSYSINLPTYEKTVTQNDISQYQRLAFNMHSAGFSVPKFMLALK